MVETVDVLKERRRLCLAEYRRLDFHHPERCSGFLRSCSCLFLMLLLWDEWARLPGERHAFLFRSFEP